jgi:hypothetical protein
MSFVMACAGRQKDGIFFYIFPDLALYTANDVTQSKPDEVNSGKVT